MPAYSDFKLYANYVRVKRNCVTLLLAVPLMPLDACFIILALKF